MVKFINLTHGKFKMKRSKVNVVFIALQYYLSGYWLCSYFTQGTHLSSCSTRLFIWRTHLSIRLSTHSTSCTDSRSFYKLSIFLTNIMVFTTKIIKETCIKCFEIYFTIMKNFTLNKIDLQRRTDHTSERDWWA